MLSDQTGCFSFGEEFWPKEAPHNPLSYFLRNGIFKSNQNKTIITIFPPKNKLWVIWTSPMTKGFASCCSISTSEDLISYLSLLFCLEGFPVFQEVSF